MCTHNQICCWYPKLTKVHNQHSHFIGPITSIMLGVYCQAVYFQTLSIVSDFTSILPLYMHSQTLCEPVIHWSTRWLCFIQAVYYSMNALLSSNRSWAQFITTSSNALPFTSSVDTDCTGTDDFASEFNQHTRTPSSCLDDCKPSHPHTVHGSVPQTFTIVHIVCTWASLPGGDILNTISIPANIVGHYHWPGTDTAIGHMTTWTHHIACVLKNPLNPILV